MFSILIPTWNNLEYLRVCIDAIARHTQVPHELIVHVNEGSDGTAQWLASQGIRHTQSPRNLGICAGLNLLAGMARHDWIVYLNDDMVVCPGWDVELIKAIKASPNDLVYLAPLLIEPRPSKSPAVIHGPFGTTVETYDEAALLAALPGMPEQDLIGEGAQPMVVARRWWHAAGGYSLELSPGMASDDDFLAKFWLLGCREFRVVGKSRVYHFSQRVTGRMRRNDGRRLFVQKWGMSTRELRALIRNPQASIDDFRGSAKSRLKRSVYPWTADVPGEDLRAFMQAALPMVLENTRNA